MRPGFHMSTGRRARSAVMACSTEPIPAHLLTQSPLPPRGLDDVLIHRLAPELGRRKHDRCLGPPARHVGSVDQSTVRADRQLCIRNACEIEEVRRVLLVIGSALAVLTAAVVLTLLWLGPVHHQQVQLACASSADRLPGCAMTTTRSSP